MTPGNTQILIHVILPVLSGTCILFRKSQLGTLIKVHLETHGHQHVFTSVQSDHVHMLFFMNPDVALSLYLKVLMRDTARSVNRYPGSDHLIWNPEYYAVSCDLSNLEELVNILQSQHLYHQSLSYNDELKQLLELMLETSCVAENMHKK